MSELLLFLGQRTRLQLLREQARLWAVRNYCDVICKSDRDAYAYYRVGEELGLDLDFSDPEKTCDLARRLDHIACTLRSRPRQLFSGAALSCASRALQSKPEQTRSSRQW